MNTILSVKDLNVTIDNSHILEDINFSLSAGETFAVIGPNGAGKTIFIKSLLNLLPFKGEINWLKGTKIGYVPQKIDADRHLPITLDDLLISKTRIFSLSSNEYAETVKIVGLSPDSLRIPIGHLSGGQFQKGLIALALLGKPHVLILDEPTASLDQPSEEHIYELIHRLQKEYKLTIIIISHDLSMVYHKTHKVMCLNKKMLFFGNTEEALKSKNLKRVFGSPLEFYDHIHKKNAVY